MATVSNAVAIATAYRANGTSVPVPLSLMYAGGGMKIEPTSVAITATIRAMSFQRTLTFSQMSAGGFVTSGPQCPGSAPRRRRRRGSSCARSRRRSCPVVSPTPRNVPAPDRRWPGSRNTLNGINAGLEGSAANSMIFGMYSTSQFDDSLPSDTVLMLTRTGVAMPDGLCAQWSAFSTTSSLIARNTFTTRFTSPSAAAARATATSYAKL